MNSAFVFIKPHAVTDKVKDLVKETFAAKSIKILKEGEITAKEIDEKMLIDNHYYAIASKATLLKPKDLPVPADKFEGKFGVAWQKALDDGQVYNALDACEKLGIDADGLDKKWGAAKKADKLIKFGGGFYCGDIDGIYVFNGFFMSMRSSFVKEGAAIYYFVVEFDSKDLKWEDFRGKVLGPTDPAAAPADSLRGLILAKWEELGLTAAPNTGENGVHASASPFEGLAERLNWVGAELETDGFGKTLLDAGIPKDKINEWKVDPQVEHAEGKGSCFDLLEDLDAEDCLNKLKTIKI